MKIAEAHIHLLGDEVESDNHAFPVIGSGIEEDVQIAQGGTPKAIPSEVCGTRPRSGERIIGAEPLLRLTDQAEQPAARNSASIPDPTQIAGIDLLHSRRCQVVAPEP